ncbi:efflux RND transporter permease subunit [Hippea jasoniae]|uniref:efflux RND transporter permease subunit n=1 Tax=Hippea jasoniae TaxID=944479 RepID=UPI0005578073|nr:multidrug efflux RND transporter permease subunit [Hippea jasoniae]
MISKFFINRPRFAIVIALIIILAGVLAIKNLPVKEYPTLSPPRVTIAAYYPGADPQTILNSVATIIEDAINGTPNLLYIESTASEGSLNISVYFKVGTDPELAKIDVNNRLQTVISKLPEPVRRLGIVVRKRNPDILKVYAFYSNTMDTTTLSNYISINVLDTLKRVDGVGDAIIWGARNYAIRVWLNPQKLYYFHLTPEDVIAAIKRQNNNFTAGSIAAPPDIERYSAYTYIVKGEGRLKSAKAFQNIIIRSLPDGATLKLKDVAKVELASESYAVKTFFNTKPAVTVGIFSAPLSNALAVSQAVDKKLKELSKNFPSGIRYSTPYDPTKFIKASIDEVIDTLIIALILVVVVVYIFLGNIRATLIPVLAIPVSIIGTFAGLYIFGFSINLLTLFGLILAIGLVVDDAIVVIENVERIMSEENLPPKEATIKAMDEITSPIIAIVLVLSAVFVPAAFLGGFTGKMFEQFAITLSISMFLSGVVALTLTPALCAVFLKKDMKVVKPIELFQRFFDWLTAKFVSTITKVIKYAFFALIIYGIVIIAIVHLYKKLPKALVPPEDKGIVFVMTYLMPGEAVSQTIKAVHQIEKSLLRNPLIKSELSVAGIDLASFSVQSNSAITFVNLKDWSKRKGFKKSSMFIAKSIMFEEFRNKKAAVYAFNPPPIMGMSITGGFSFYIQNRKGDPINLFLKNINNFIAQANRDKKLMSVRTTLIGNIPQFDIKVNRQKAKMLGVNINDIYSTITAYFSRYYVNDFNLYGKVFHVDVEAAGNFRKSIYDYRYIFVKSRNGAMVPIDTLITVKRTTAPSLLERFNLFDAAKIIGMPAAGFTTGDAMKEIIKLAKQYLPEGYTIAWSGASLQQLKAQKKGLKAYIFSIIFVFLILTALYESFSAPVSILLSIPFAILGAVGGLYLLHLENDIYMQVGIITLIGLSAKNAILLVEFGFYKLKEGLTLLDATKEAAKIRFRPIVMTSVAFIAGSLSLILSSGAGAMSRHIIGIVVVSGMVAATLIGVLFIPLFFYLIQKLKGSVG